MVLPGIGRTPGNWLRPVLIVVLSTIGPARRMRVEEAALLGTTGEPSARYAPGQPRLFHRL
jgi:hypothetical protein